MDKGYFSNESGLVLASSVMRVDNERKFPIMIINSTNKTFKLCRGCVVGKAECIQSENIIVLTERLPEVNEISESDLLAMLMYRQSTGKGFLGF